MAASAGGISTATAVGLALTSVGLGVGIGRSIWTVMARRNARDVERVADELAAAARDAGTQPLQG